MQPGLINKCCGCFTCAAGVCVPRWTAGSSCHGSWLRSWTHYVSEDCGPEGSRGVLVPPGVACVAACCAGEWLHQLYETRFTHRAVHLVPVVSVHPEVATSPKEHFHGPDALTPQTLTRLTCLLSACQAAVASGGWLVQHACFQGPSKL